MVRELGGSERSARIGALIVLVNPVTWFDSVVWGQVDSVGVVVPAPRAARAVARPAGARRDPGRARGADQAPARHPHPDRRHRRHPAGLLAEGRLRPRGRARAAATRRSAWEERIRGPIRVADDGPGRVPDGDPAVAAVRAEPARADRPGLQDGRRLPIPVRQRLQPVGAGHAADGRWTRGGHRGLDRSWVCDSQIVAAPPSEFRIGPFVIPELGFPGSTVDKCPDGVFIGAFPAALVGMALFLIAAAIVLWFIARRPDRLTMVVGLAVLALAFFILPTRVHERYLFPLAAIGAILAAVSLRWRIAYILSAAATIANMYVVLVNYYHDEPEDHRLARRGADARLLVGRRDRRRDPDGHLRLDVPAAPRGGGRGPRRRRRIRRPRPDGAIAPRALDGPAGARAGPRRDRPSTGATGRSGLRTASG